MAMTSERTAVGGSAPEISVIVPAYRGIATICACLDSIFEATRDWRCEVLVVESSGDGTAALVRRRFPRAILIESATRLSAGQARNVGIRQARGRWVLCADQDCIVPGDWADRLVRLLKIPGAGAAGGSITVANPHNLSGWCVYFLEFLYHFPSRWPVDDGNFLIGANSAWQAEVLRQVSFPDQTLGEDRRLSHEVRQLGRRVLFDPSLAVRHHNRSGWTEFVRYCEAMGVSAAQEQIRNGGRLIAFLRKFPWISFAIPFVVLPDIGRRLLVGRPDYFALYLLLLGPCAFGQFVWARAFSRTLAHARHLPSADPSDRT